MKYLLDNVGSNSNSEQRIELLQKSINLLGYNRDVLFHWKNHIIALGKGHFFND
jgi:hypothetical protein